MRPASRARRRVMRAMPTRFAACFSESKFGQFCVVSMVVEYYQSRTRKVCSGNTKRTADKGSYRKRTTFFKEFLVLVDKTFKTDSICLRIGAGSMPKGVTFSGFNQSRATPLILARPF